MIVYVSIGNSDDKLTQARWSTFWYSVDDLVRQHADHIHGVWASLPTDRWQSACWCFEWDGRTTMKDQLALHAAEYGQNAIAWAQVPQTELIAGRPLP